MTLRRLDRRNRPLLIAALIFVMGGGLLFAISMDDGPGPPQKRQVMPSGFTAQMLEDKQSPSALLFIKTCTQCHDLPNPKLHTADEWPAIVREMVSRLRRRRFFSSQPLFVPGNKTAEEIVAYLTGYAAPKSLPEAPP